MFSHCFFFVLFLPHFEPSCIIRPKPFPPISPLRAEMDTNEISSMKNDTKMFRVFVFGAEKYFFLRCSSPLFIAVTAIFLFLSVSTRFWTKIGLTEGKIDCVAEMKVFLVVCHLS